MTGISEVIEIKGLLAEVHLAKDRLFPHELRLYLDLKAKFRDEQPVGHRDRTDLETILSNLHSRRDA